MDKDSYDVRQTYHEGFTMIIREARIGWDEEVWLEPVNVGKDTVALHGHPVHADDGSGAALETRHPWHVPACRISRQYMVWSYSFLTLIHRSLENKIVFQMTL